MTAPLLLRSFSRTNNSTPVPSLVTIKAEPLTPGSFSPFGVVTSFPLTRSLQSRTLPIPSPNSPILQSDHRALQPSYVHANQGTALKFVNAAPLLDLYDNAPSSSSAVDGEDISSEAEPRARPDSGRGAVSTFSCFPRPPSSFRRSTPRLPSVETSATDNPTRDNIMLPLTVLERHPYTTQSFIPLGLSRDDDSAAFLVVVAPTLPNTTSPALATTAPSPSTATTIKPTTEIHQPPSIPEIRAFLARGDQAVTYNPGTWHAPMIVLGRHRIDFVVVQHVSGVAEEDCQEVSLCVGSEDGGVKEGGFAMWDVQVDLGSLAELGFDLPAAVPVTDKVTDTLGVKDPGLSPEGMERKWQEQRSRTPDSGRTKL